MSPTRYQAYSDNGILYVDAADVNWNNDCDVVGFTSTLSTEASLSTTSETVCASNVHVRPTNIYDIYKTVCELQDKISILEKEIEELKLARIKQEELEGLI